MKRIGDLVVRLCHHGGQVLVLVVCRLGVVGAASDFVVLVNQLNGCWLLGQVVCVGHPPPGCLMGFVVLIFPRMSPPGRILSLMVGDVVWPPPRFAGVLLGHDVVC